MKQFFSDLQWGICNLGFVAPVVCARQRSCLPAEAERMRTPQTFSLIPDCGCGGKWKMRRRQR